MPSMDVTCFIGDDDIRVNFISFAVFEKFEFEKVKERIEGFMRDKQKLRSSVVRIWGDLYWKDNSIEETIDYVLSHIPKRCQNEREIEEFVNKDLNNEMPLNKP